MAIKIKRKANPVVKTDEPNHSAKFAAHALSAVKTPLLASLNEKQQQKRRSKAQETSLKMRQYLWPGLKEDQLWNRKTKYGFTTIPRTMPTLMNIINDLSKKVNDGKAAPAGKAYLVLWCRVWDEGIVRIENEAVAAAEAGYTGERNITTWRSHLKILKSLEFIDYKDEGSTKYILIFNPYHVIKARRNEIQTGIFTDLYQRALEIGAASDFDS